MKNVLALATALMVAAIVPAAASAADQCPNAELRHQQGAAWLPECRAYELVSPVNKNGNAVLAVFGVRASGGGFAFWSTGAFAGAQSSSGVNYVALRGVDSWKTRAVNPPMGHDGLPPSILTEVLPLDLADDFSRALIETTYPVDENDQGGNEPNGFRDVYRIEPDGSPTWVSHGHLVPQTTATKNVVYHGASGDLDRIVFATPDTHHPDVPEASTDQHVYEWADGEAHLISRGPDGDPMPGGATVGLPASVSSVAFGLSPTAVSPDASRVVLTSPPTTSGQLYLRTDRTTTVQISATQRVPADPEPRRPSLYRDATSDTSKVLFSSSDALTNDAIRGVSQSADHTLYLYDTETGTLHNVSPYDNPSAPVAEQEAGPRVRATIGLADDGSRVYFIARGRLVEGAGPTAGGQNLYVYDAATDQVDFIATVNTGEADARDEAEVNSSGDEMLFRSTRALAPGGVAGTMNWFVFRAATGELVCASCTAQGNGIGDMGSVFNGVEYARRAPVRDSLSDDGHVFFTSTVSLVPRDTNGVADVYEWVDGQLHLLTTGKSPYPSVFVGATPNGREAYVLTNESLTGHDIDNGVADAYAVSVNGGFPEPQPGVGCTSGCRAPGVHQPFASPGSESYLGRELAPVSPRAAFALRPLTRAQRARLARGRGRVPVRVRVNRAGRVVLTARARIGARRRVVARAVRRASRAGTVRLRVRLSTPARRALARGKRLRLTFTVRFAGVGEPRRMTLNLKGGRR